MNFCLKCTPSSIWGIGRISRGLQTCCRILRSCRRSSDHGSLGCCSCKFRRLVLWSQAGCRRCCLERCQHDTALVLITDHYNDLPVRFDRCSIASPSRHRALGPSPYIKGKWTPNIPRRQYASSSFRVVLRSFAHAIRSETL